MSKPEQVDVLILGSGNAGKLLAWHMAQSGQRTAVVARRWIEGFCPNTACPIEGDDILVAAGRAPNTAGIGLKKAGFELDARGYIRLNGRLETSAPDAALGGSTVRHFATYSDHRSLT